jgi:hypothetical protein
VNVSAGFFWYSKSPHGEKVDGGDGGIVNI